MEHFISYKRIPRIRLSDAAKEALAYGLSLLFVILFFYTAYHKAVDIGTFSRGIAKIPVVGIYSVGTAWGVLGAEVVVSLLLIWPGTNRLGLWGALGLMVIFTGYIGSMLLFAERLPCHCGGAIEKLTWGQHLLFNCGFIALAAGLLLCHYKVNIKHKILTAMKAINSKIKKAVFGMMAAALTIGFSAFTTANSKHVDGELAGREAPNRWVLIDPAEEGITWECLPTGQVCTGTLKEGAMPNEDGSYNDSEVDYPSEPQNEHFAFK